MIKNFFANALKYIIFIFMFATVAFLAVLAYKDYDSNKLAETIRNATSIFSCITASATLTFTVLTRDETKKERKDERKKDAIYKWCNNLVVERNLNATLSFFDECINLVDDFKTVGIKREELTGKEYDDKIRKNIICPFTQKYIRIQQQLVADASIINEDFSKDLQSNFEKFQDVFIDYTQKQNPNYQEMKIRILDSRRKIINLIKEYSVSTIN